MTALCDRRKNGKLHGVPSDSFGTDDNRRRRRQMASDRDRAHRPMIRSATVAPPVANDDGEWRRTGRRTKEHHRDSSFSSFSDRSLSFDDQRSSVSSVGDPSSLRQTFPFAPSNSDNGTPASVESSLPPTVRLLPRGGGGGGGGGPLVIAGCHFWPRDDAAGQSPWNPDKSLPPVKHRSLNNQDESSKDFGRCVGPKRLYQSFDNSLIRSDIAETDRHSSALQRSGSLPRCGSGVRSIRALFDGGGGRGSRTLPPPSSEKWSPFAVRRTASSEERSRFASVAEILWTMDEGSGRNDSIFDIRASPKSLVEYDVQRNRTRDADTAPSRPMDAETAAAATKNRAKPLRNRSATTDIASIQQYPDHHLPLQRHNHHHHHHHRQPIVALNPQRQQSEFQELGRRTKVTKTQENIVPIVERRTEAAAILPAYESVAAVLRTRFKTASRSEDDLIPKKDRGASNTVQQATPSPLAYISTTASLKRPPLQESTVPSQENHSSKEDDSSQLDVLPIGGSSVHPSTEPPAAVHAKTPLCYSSFTYIRPTQPTSSATSSAATHMTSREEPVTSPPPRHESSSPAAASDTAGDGSCRTSFEAPPSLSSTEFLDLGHSLSSFDSPIPVMSSSEQSQALLTNARSMLNTSSDFVVTSYSTTATTTTATTTTAMMMTTTTSVRPSSCFRSTTTLSLGGATTKTNECSVSHRINATINRMSTETEKAVATERREEQEEEEEAFARQSRGESLVESLVGDDSECDSHQRPADVTFVSPPTQHDNRKRSQSTESTIKKTDFSTEVDSTSLPFDPRQPDELPPLPPPPPPPPPPAQHQLNFERGLERLMNAAAKCGREPRSIFPRLRSFRSQQTRDPFSIRTITLSPDEQSIVCGGGGGGRGGDDDDDGGGRTERRQNRWASADDNDDDDSLGGLEEGRNQGPEIPQYSVEEEEDGDSEFDDLFVSRKMFDLPKQSVIRRNRLRRQRRCLSSSSSSSSCSSSSEGDRKNDEGKKSERRTMALKRTKKNIGAVGISTKMSASLSAP